MRPRRRRASTDHRTPTPPSKPRSNPAAGDVGYRAPSVPTDRPAPYDTTLDDEIQSIEEELDSLARVVTERLENDYFQRDEGEFGFFSEEE